MSTLGKENGTFSSIPSSFLLSPWGPLLPHPLETAPVPQGAFSLISNISAPTKPLRTFFISIFSQKSSRERKTIKQDKRAGLAQTQGPKERFLWYFIQLFCPSNIYKYKQNKIPSQESIFESVAEQLLANALCDEEASKLVCVLQRADSVLSL